MLVPNTYYLLTSKQYSLPTCGCLQPPAKLARSPTPLNPAGFEPRIPRVPDSGPVVPCVSFPRLTCELAAPTVGRRSAAIRDAGLPHQQVRIAAHGGRAGCRCFCRCAHMPLPNAHPILCHRSNFQGWRTVCVHAGHIWLGAVWKHFASASAPHTTYTDPIVLDRRCPRSIALECTNAESGCPNAPTPRRQVSGARATKSHAR